VADVTQVDQLLHGEETHTAGDAGYSGVHKRPEHEGRTMIWAISARPSSYKKHGKKCPIGRAKHKVEYTKLEFATTSDLP